MAIVQVLETPEEFNETKPTFTETRPVDNNAISTKTLDFDNHFSQSSPLTPFSWATSDYLKGWYTVGSTPPARTQFDALQKLSDEKDSYLLEYAEYHDTYEAYLKNTDSYLKRYCDKLTDVGNYLKRYCDNLNTWTSFLNDWKDELDTRTTELSRVKADINSPTFTGTPKAPTPPDGDSSTRIATTAFVQNLIDGLELEDDESGGESGGGSDISPIGYVKLKGGLILQWGAIMVEGYGEELTFPIEFEEACYALVGMDIGAYNTTPQYLVAGQVSKTGFLAGALIDKGEPNYGGCWASFIAVGK